MSIEHIKYLKKEKRNKLIIKIIQISILIIFLLLWEYLGKKNIIKLNDFQIQQKTNPAIKTIIVSISNVV